MVLLLLVELRVLQQSARPLNPKDIYDQFSISINIDMHLIVNFLTLIDKIVTIYLYDKSINI